MAPSAKPLPQSSPSGNAWTDTRLIVALDVSSASEADSIVVQLKGLVHSYKVGMQLYTAAGPEIVRGLVRSGHEVFLDLKYHDIPNTVASAVGEAARLGVSMLTVHASGGTKMLKAAAEAASSANRQLHVLAVTVLTSMAQDDLTETGVQRAVVDQVVALGTMALEAGCAGIVSSAHEVKALRATLGSNFLAVTPGVRPAGSAHGDQARVVTPAEAIAAGASHIVVGRPITAAKDPAAAARLILEEMQSLKPQRSPKVSS
ncbi:MAG TPA: orotidine-5'-phosphate decarboxylase [Terriglobales bacterium]|nr:orotidine-5'-phosphate decarboxylase [Terriglobales bacterium]